MTTLPATIVTSAPGPDGPVLQARELTHSYGRSPALRGISLEVARGEMLAVTGPSGSGKSTLLLCLAGVLRPDSGEITFRGRRIDSESEADRSARRCREFGVLFQFGQLVPELTAVENVALPLLLAGAGRRAAVATAREWLDRFGVADLATQHPTEMSGGQSQRVAVARAMVTGPEILFADEPTGALDTLAGERVLSELTRVAVESGTTVILVTHDARVAAYATREITVRDGRLAGAR